MTGLGLKIFLLLNKKKTSLKFPLIRFIYFLGERSVSKIFITDESTKIYRILLRDVKLLLVNKLTFSLLTPLLRGALFIPFSLKLLSLFSSRKGHPTAADLAGSVARRQGAVEQPFANVDALFSGHKFVLFVDVLHVPVPLLGLSLDTDLVLKLVNIVVKLDHFVQL